MIEEPVTTNYAKFLNISPVNLGIFEAQHQTNCDIILLSVRVAYLAKYQKSAKIRSVEHVKIKR